MERIIGECGNLFENMIYVKNQMKDIELTRELQSSFLGRLYANEEILTITQAGIVKKEMDNPSFDYGDSNTAWSFYQHCTHSFKTVTPRTYLPNQIKLTNFFQKALSI
jgi:hypothetical protein